MLHFFFFSVEFNSLFCFLIRKIYGICSDFLEKKQIKKILPRDTYPSFDKRSICLFHLLIPAGVVNCQTPTTGLILRLPHCWLFFRRRLGLYTQGRWAQIQLFLPSFLDPLVAPHPLSVSCLLFLSDPAVSHILYTPSMLAPIFGCPRGP